MELDVCGRPVFTNPVTFTESKKRFYGAYIWEVEQSSFIPLIFSATGGMANEATVFYKRLTSLLSGHKLCSCNWMGMVRQLASQSVENSVK